MHRKSESDGRRMEDRDLEDLPGDDFHRKLFESLDAACKETGQIVNDVSKDKHFAMDFELVMPRVQQAALRCTAMMEKAEFLCRAMEHRIVALHAEGQQLEAREELLRQEQDAVSTRGHELYWRGNCREMERNLADSFIARERCLSVEGARSFRDEVSEKLLRTTDLLRIAELRACSLDSQLHHTMKLMGQALEKWRMARGELVEALDNLAQLQRDKILEWLTSSEPRSEAQQKLGEQTVDYLHLLQQERHLTVQVLQSALGMCTFNVSLDFDRASNLKQQRQFDELQEKLHAMLQKPGVHLRAATATTDLLKYQQEQEQAKNSGALLEKLSLSRQDEMLNGACHEGGTTLHRCGKVSDLATLVMQALGRQPPHSVYQCKIDSRCSSRRTFRVFSVTADHFGDAEEFTQSMRKIEHRVTIAAQEDDRYLDDSEDNHTEDSWFSEDRGKDKVKGKDSRVDQVLRERRSIDGSDNDTTDFSDTDTYDDEVYRGRRLLVPRASTLSDGGTQQDGKDQRGFLGVRQGGELLAKGDIDSNIGVMMTGSNNDAHMGGAAAGREPFTVRLRRRFSFTPRSDSMTNAYAVDDVKVRSSGSDPSQNFIRTNYCDGKR